MTIFARDPDTGMAKWVYQMTPHDEWDYDGVNEMILADRTSAATDASCWCTSIATASATRSTAPRRAAGRGEVRSGGELGHQGRHGQEQSKTYGRPLVVDAVFDRAATARTSTSKGICPAALGTKDQQPAAFSPETRLFYVPTNHVCMDYEPFQVSYTAGQPYVGATLSHVSAPKGETDMGNFIAWDARTGKIVWSNKEQFSVWSGALATAGGVVFYGTLEGYLKAVDAKTGKELYKFKTPSGIIGNVMTYEHGGKQYVAVLSGVGGWAGIGLAAGLLSMTSRGWHDAVDQGKLPTKETGYRYGRPRRGRRLCGLRSLHRARRHADSVRAAELDRTQVTDQSGARQFCCAPVRLEPINQNNYVQTMRKAVHSVVWRALFVVLLARSVPLPMDRATRPPSSTKTASTWIRMAIPPSRSSPMGRSIGTLTPASAAITRSATSATGPTAKVQLMRRR